MIRPHVDSLAAWRALHLTGRPAKLSIDAEVRAYVDELLAANTFQQVADACLARFGAERAPGKSAVHRYFRAVQAAAAQESFKPPQNARAGGQSGRSGRVSASGRPIPPITLRSKELKGV